MTKLSQKLGRLVLEQYPLEAARLIEDAPPAQITSLLLEQAPENAASIVAAMVPDAAVATLCTLQPSQASAFLQRMEPRRASMLLARMDDAARTAIENDLAPQLQKELEELRTYPADTAAGIMNPRPTTFRLDDTVSDVVSKLKRHGYKRIQDVFVVEPEGKLAGSIPLLDVLLAPRQAELRTLLEGEPRAVLATMPRDEVLAALRENPNGSLPVVDYAGRLLGVLRQAELLRATEREAISQVLTMVGASEDERALSPFYISVRKRLPWLMVNLLTAFLAASVVGVFESTIARFTALAVLLPVVAGQSGNTGAQALAVTMRGLALREVRTRHWMRVAFKEMAAGATNGVAVACVTGAAVWWWSGTMGLGLVIAVSMVLSMTIAGLAGAVIPMVLTAMRQDPAQSSSIVLTTVTDVAGFMSFLGIATALSSLLG